MHHACMDEDDLACRDFAKAVALVDEPLANDQLYDFGLVSECFFQAGFAFLVVLLVPLFLQPLAFLDRHFCSHVNFPFSADQELKHFLQFFFHAFHPRLRVVSDEDLASVVVVRSRDCPHARRSGDI